MVIYILTLIIIIIMRLYYAWHLAHFSRVTVLHVWLIQIINECGRIFRKPDAQLSASEHCKRKQ